MDFEVYRISKVNKTPLLIRWDVNDKIYCYKQQVLLLTL